MFEEGLGCEAGGSEEDGFVVCEVELSEEGIHCNLEELF